MMTIARTIARTNALTRTITTQTIKSKMLASMKAGDKRTTAVLRSVLADMTYAEKASASSNPRLTDVIRSAIKRRNDAASEFRTGGRIDLAENEDAEAVVLKDLLPSQMTEQLLLDEARSVLSRLDPPVDLGTLIKAMSANLDPDAAPRKLVAAAAKQALAR